MVGREGGTTGGNALWGKTVYKMLYYHEEPTLPLPSPPLSANAALPQPSICRLPPPGPPFTSPPRTPPAPSRRQSGVPGTSWQGPPPPTPRPLPSVTHDVSLSFCLPTGRRALKSGSTVTPRDPLQMPAQGPAQSTGPGHACREMGRGGRGAGGGLEKVPEVLLQLLPCL